METGHNDTSIQLTETRIRGSHTSCSHISKGLWVSRRVRPSPISLHMGCLARSIKRFVLTNLRQALQYVDKYCASGRH